jgi:WD40 repeat protein
MKTLAKMVGTVSDREISFAGNGGRIVSIDKGAQTAVFETATGRRSGVTTGNIANGLGSFSPDEKYLASVLAGNMVHLIESESGKESIKLQGHTGNINRVMFSPGGEMILTVSNDNTARLWESASGRLVTVWDHPSEVTEGQFSPDGSHVVTLSTSGARLWKVQSDQQGIDLGGKQQYDAIIFNPDGSTVLLVSSDRREISEFDLQTGQSLAFVTLRGRELQYYSGPLANLVVSDDRSMIGSQENETVWSLPWSLQDYVDKVKALLPRCLTPDERKEAYLDPEPPEWCVEMEKWPYNTSNWKQWLKDKLTAKENLAQ